MPYGTIKVDNVIYTKGGVDTTITVSGIVDSLSGAISVTGAISGASVSATTGTFTTLSGNTTAGTTATFTSGIFTTFSGTTVNVVSGVFASGTVALPSVSVGTSGNGLYSPGANQLAISTSGTGRLTVDNLGNVNIDSGTFYVDAVNNRVGVGTTGPATLLDLSSTTSAKLNLSYPGFGIATLASDSTGALLLQADEANTQAGSLIQFKVDGTERMRLDASGNLGLGVVPSANGSIYYRTFELGKAGCGLFVGTSSLSGSELTYFAGNAVLSYNAGPLWSYGNAGGAAAYGIEDGAHKWLTTTTTGTTGGAITFTQAMTLDASGRLLVGTTSDSGGALLQINGDRIRVATAKTPASATAAGTAGEVCWDANYIYVCTATNTWKRAAIATW